MHTAVAGDAPLEMVEIDVESEPFLISATEVSRGLWERVMEVELEACPGCGPEHPVTGVSWRDAVIFANALSRSEGRRPAYVLDEGGEVAVRRRARGYRLPTEREWLLAARAGGKGPFAGSGEASDVCRVGNVLNPSVPNPAGWVTFDCDDGHQSLAPRRSLEPNAWGLHDMTGNAAEWVYDRYLADVAGPRVILGGSFQSGVDRTQLGHRNYASENYRRSDLGFRLAMSLH